MHSSIYVPKKDQKNMCWWLVTKWRIICSFPAKEQCMQKSQRDAGRHETECIPELRLYGREPLSSSPPANLPHDSLPSSSHASKHSPGQTATSGMQERHPSEQWEHTDVRRTSGNLLGKWDTQTSGACLEISWANGQIMRHGAQNDPSMRRFDTHHTSR